MLSKKIGDQLDCVVTGLTSFGVFVQCRKFGIEGLIRTEDLGPDDWKFNAKNQSLIGSRSGAKIRLGRAMKVNIVSVNIPARQLNLGPVEPLAQEPKEREKAKPRRKRRYTNRRKNRRC
jgi:ribonuclease R